MRNFAVALLLFFIGFTQTPAVFAQGSLTPPGPPGPTMKTLSQIEPRTPISAAYTITQPGSYYLTTNLANISGDSIDINTNNVTLDLCGFSISSTSSNGYAAIALANNTLHDITIRNGHIVGAYTNYGTNGFSGGGFEFGIVYYGPFTPSPNNVQVSGLSVNGCLYDGIFAGTNALVDSCTVQSVGAYGIFGGIVSHCTVYQCGSAAIQATTVSDSCGQNLNNSYGIYADIVNASQGYSPGGYGIYATRIVNNSIGTSGTGIGIAATIANASFSSTGDSAIINRYNMP